MNIKDLIIERPQSQSVTQRWTSNFLTTVAWCLLFYGFLPIAGFVVGERAVLSVPLEHNITSMRAWSSLVPLLPWWALAVACLITALYVWATVQFIRFRDSRRSAQTAEVTTAEMAAHCNHPEPDVREWGSARRAVAHYDEATVMVSVSVALDEPFREVPREGEPTAPLAPLAMPASSLDCARARQELVKADLGSLRARLVDLWGRVEAVELTMRDVAENRARRENNRDVVLYAGLKDIRTGLLANIATTRQQLAEARYLFEEQIRVEATMAAFKPRV